MALYGEAYFSLCAVGSSWEHLCSHKWLLLVPASSEGRCFCRERKRAQTREVTAPGCQGPAQQWTCAWCLRAAPLDSGTLSNVGESFSKNHGIPAIAARGGENERMQVDVLWIGGTGNSTSASLLIDWVESSQETLNKLASLLVSVSWRLGGLSGCGRDAWRKENAAYSLWRNPVDSINHGHFMMFW